MAFSKCDGLIFSGSQWPKCDKLFHSDSAIERMWDSSEVGLVGGLEVAGVDPIQRQWVLAPFFPSSSDPALPHQQKTRAIEPTNVESQPPLWAKNKIIII